MEFGNSPGAGAVVPVDCRGVDPSTLDTCSSSHGASDCCVCTSDTRSYACPSGKDIGKDSVDFSNSVMPAASCPTVYWQHR